MKSCFTKIPLVLLTFPLLLLGMIVLTLDEGLRFPRRRPTLGEAIMNHQNQTDNV